MPAFKSEAQRKKFAELVKAGKMSPEEFARWADETGNAKLPERASDPAKEKTTFLHGHLPPHKRK